MRFSVFLAALFIALASQATAQDIVAFQLGIDGDFENTQPLAYTNARAEDANFILTVGEGFIPLAAEQAARATETGLSAVVCGLVYGPFPPTSMAQGEVVVPLGNAATAEAAAQMMLGQIDCQTFLQQRVDLSANLAPVEFLPTGLTIVSPSESIFFDIGDIFLTEITLNPTSGNHDLHLQFSTFASDWLIRQTSAHIGQELQLIVCGEIISSPLIQAPITSDTIVIAGSADKSETELARELILGFQPCP